MCIIMFMQKLTDSTYTSLTARWTWFIWLLLVILKQTLAINDADLTTGQMPFLQHNQQRQSTEGNSKQWPQPSLIQLLTPKGRRRQTPSTLGLRRQYTEVTDREVQRWERRCKAAMTHDVWFTNLQQLTRTPTPRRLQSLYTHNGNSSSSNNTFNNH